jgi:polyphosphate glucokinase
MEYLGIDVGGSGIKGALVYLDKGVLASEKVRIPTPRSFKPEEIVDTIDRIVKEHDYRGPLGVGFPAVVMGGKVISPPTAYEFRGWIGMPLEQQIAEKTGCTVRLVNDADAAGLAEVNYGAGRGVPGVVITVTLGTGIGSGLFMDGELVPNLELGKLHLKKHKKFVEHYVASRVRKDKGLTWKKYRKRLTEFCTELETLFSPSLIILGGGISSKKDKILPRCEMRLTRVVAAELLNEAGIVGAAAATQLRQLNSR